MVKAHTNGYEGVNRDSITLEQGIIQYEPQYDPNNDFKIFGVGDPTKGGIQSMKEKMNMADEKDQDSSEESEIDTARQNQMAQASATKAQLLAQNAESYKLSIPTILEPSSS